MNYNEQGMPLALWPQPTEFQLILRFWLPDERNGADLRPIYGAYSEHYIF